MKLTVSNANITNTLSTASITLGNTNIINSVSIGNVSITSAEIDVGNVVITPTAISVPALVLGGTQFAGGLQGGIINYQEFTANGTWNNPYYFANGVSYSQGLTYKFYTQGTSTNPTTEAGLDALFNTATSSPTVTFGGTGIHSGTINWGDSGQTGAGGAVGTKPAYLPADQFSWMVEGYILAPETGTYFFGVDGDDAVDVFVNGVNVASYYGSHGFNGAWTGGATGGTQVSGSISLTAGQYYTFRARQQDGGGGDGIQVGWRKPSDGSIGLIPANAFFIQSTTYTVNTSLTGYEQVLVMAWGGGGGGIGNSSYIAAGGGGACVLGNYTLANLSNTVSVTIGLGGNGSLATGNGFSGGATSFGSLIAYGGGGATFQVTNPGGGGGGTFSSGITAGGSPLGGAVPSGVSTFGGGGGANNNTSGGGASIFGGGGGSSTTTNFSGNSIFGGGGGGNGVSVFAGSGGATSPSNSLTNRNGVAPAGGGGANTTGGGNGARGEVRVWVFGPAGTTAGAPTYTLTANTTSVYGGDSIVYTVATTNIANGTNLYYTLNNSSAAVSTDFSTAVNGSVVINGGTGTFTLTSNNRSYSSNTGMTFDIRSGSTTGPIVATNNSIVIRKTPTITYLGDYSQETGLGADSTVTLTSQTLGTANTTRRIVVAVARYRNDSSLTPTVTVAGITATRLVGWAGNYNTTNIYIADVPTGTTGNIVVTNAVDHYNGVTITWYALYDLGSSAAVSSAEAHGSVFNRSLTLNTLNQSIVIFKSSRYASNSPTSITVDGTAGLTTVDADVRYDTVYYFYGTAGSKNMVPEGALTVRINVGTKSEIGASAIAIR